MYKGVAEGGGEEQRGEKAEEPYRDLKRSAHFSFIGGSNNWREETILNGAGLIHSRKHGKKIRTPKRMQVNEQDQMGERWLVRLKRARITKTEEGGSPGKGGKRPNRER